MIIENEERVTMPYEGQVSPGTCEFLGAVGAEVAYEHRLRTNYHFTEVHEMWSDGSYFKEVPVYGQTKADAERTLVEVEERAAELGLHARFDSDLVSGLLCSRYEVIETRNMVTKDVSTGHSIGTRYTDDHSFNVAEYGALPETIIGTIDGLAHTERVRLALQFAGREQVLFDLLDNLEGYANKRGNTASVFDLTSAGTYTALRSKLDEEISDVREGIDDHPMTGLPIIGEMARERALEKLWSERERKEAIIDDLEKALVA